MWADPIDKSTIMEQLQREADKRGITLDALLDEKHEHELEKERNRRNGFWFWLFNLFK